MKTIKNNLRPAMLMISFCLAMMLTFTNCGSDEDGDDIMDDGPCAQLECLNSGEALYDVEFGKCRCNCPSGYTGEFCEIKI